MTRTVHARFDGKAFYPEEPLSIAPNTTVLLTVETSEASESPPPPPAGPPAVAIEGEPYSFLKFAMSLNLEGPKDWSENLDDYLYGGKKLPND
jgi:hypothetical protein